MKDLILIGKQGAGKGVEGELLAEKFGFKIFETGKALRKITQEGSELGNKIKDIINNGNLVSDELIMEIVKDFLINTPKDTPIIFDGIPRSEEQRKMLEFELMNMRRGFEILEIKLSDKTALNRLLKRSRCNKCGANFIEDACPKCGSTDVTKRDDDNKIAILKRLENFEKHTLPAIEEWRKEGKIISVSGEGSINECFDEIIGKLADK